MRPASLLPAFTLLSAAACTAPEGTARDVRLDLEPVPAPARPVEASSPAHEVVVAVPVPAPVSEPRADEGLLDPVALELWNSPAFQRRFAQSYIAETEIEPRVTSVELETMIEVRDLLAKDKVDKAVALLEDNMNGTPSAVFDFTLANLHVQADRVELAEAGYRKAVEKYPKFRRAWSGLGELVFRQGRFDEVAKALTKVIELGGGDGTTYGLLGWSYLNTESILPAESAYRMALMHQPENVSWKIGLAQCLFKQRRFGEAVTLLDALIAEYPERTELWENQGNAYIGLGQPLRAAENFELLDRMGQSSAESLNLLGDIYVNQELFDLAAGAYHRALVQQGGDVARALASGRELILRGAIDEGEILLTAVEERAGSELEDGDRQELLRLRARVAVARGQGDEEARILREVVSLDPLDGEALVLLGRYEARNGNPEQAMLYFERAAGLERFEADAKVLWAEVLVKQGKFAQALPLLKRAQQLRPRDHVQAYLADVERRAQGR
jgi:tetratricopeptide (TPR) repeat protein